MPSGSSVGPTNRLNTRHARRPMSSITANTAGTNTRDSSVEESRPPITAMAMGARNSPPESQPIAAGSMPAIMAMVVMTMGRARLRPASTMASVRPVPRCIDSMAKSTSMMAFLVTMPISIRMPITTGRLIGWPVTASATMAPPMDSGSENRMVTGCRKLPNRSTSTA